jgi:hypothetical protein
MKTTAWKLLLALGLLAAAAPLAVAQIGLGSDPSGSAGTTSAPAGGALSAPGKLAAPYGTGTAQLGTGPGAYGIKTPIEVGRNPGITYGTQGQLGTGMGQLSAPYGTGTGRLGGDSSALGPTGAAGGVGLSGTTSPGGGSVYGAGAVPTEPSSTQGGLVPDVDKPGPAQTVPGQGQFGQGAGAYGSQPMSTPPAGASSASQLGRPSSTYSPQGPLGQAGAAPITNPQGVRGFGRGTF